MKKKKLTEITDLSTAQLRIEQLEAKLQHERDLLWKMLDDVCSGEERIANLKDAIRARDRRIFFQRRQLRELAEKLEAMKTWRGWFRTAGQMLGLCR
jgi:septal ring factor EnvC (AmiA/AmiB activator)